LGTEKITTQLSKLLYTIMLFAGYSFAGPWYIVKVEASGELRFFLDICALTLFFRGI